MERARLRTAGSRGVSVRVGVLMAWLVVVLTVLSVVPVAGAATTDDDPPRVTAVTGELGLGHPITLRAKGLREYLESTGRKASEVVLFLDGRAIDDVTARLVPGKDRVVFDVRRTDASVETWVGLLGSPKHTYRRMSVSMGFADGEAWPTVVDSYPLSIIRPRGIWLVLWWASLVAVALACVVLARETPILREPSLMPVKERPFSLGRVQMAVWFVLVVVAFLFLWIMTQATPPLSETALALMGVSAATGLGSVLIDQNKQRDAAKSDPERVSRRRELRTELTTTEKPLAEADLVEKAKKVGYRPSQGFWSDIVCDADGCNLHRVQIVVWTAILAVVFLVSTWRVLSMPEFSGTLLALMGLSGGTYLGFKWPEATAEATG